MFGFLRRRKNQKDDVTKRQSAQPIRDTTRLSGWEMVARKPTRDAACRVPEQNEEDHQFGPERQLHVAERACPVASTESLTIRNPFRHDSSDDVVASSSRHHIDNACSERIIPVECIRHVERREPLIVHPHGELGNLSQRAEVMFAGARGECGLPMDTNPSCEHDIFERCFSDDLDMAPWGVSGTVSPTESAISSPIMSRTSSFMVYPVDFLQVKIPAGVFTPAEEPSRSVWTVR